MAALAGDIANLVCVRQCLFAQVKRLNFRKSEPATPRVAPNGAAPPASGVHDILSDEEARALLRAAQAYDDRAFARLYHLFADRIFRFIYFRLGDRNRAEELTSDLFVRLLESIGNFRLGPKDPALALTAWIYRIARNLVIDDYRRRQVRGETQPLLEEDELDSPHCHKALQGFVTGIRPLL